MDQSWQLFLRNLSSQQAIILPYSGWLGHRNVGDEIVFDLLCKLIQSEIATRRPLVQITLFQEIDPETAQFFDWGLASGAILGGGSTIDPFYLEFLRIAMQKKLPIFSFSAGFQLDDGLSDDQIARLRLIDSVKYGSVRGARSLQMIEKLTGCSSQLTPILDSGILTPLFYAPFSDVEYVQVFTAKIRKSGKYLVAINVMNLDWAIFEMLSFMRSTADDYAFVLLPFDDDTLIALLSIAAELGDSVSCHIETDFLNYRLLTTWYNACEFSINMKLHASVLSASVGTPPIGFGGGFKITEFFATIRCSELHDTVLTADSLLAAAQKLQGRKNDYFPLLKKLRESAHIQHTFELRRFFASQSHALDPRINSSRVVAMRGKDYGIIVVAPDSTFAETAIHELAGSSF